LTAARDEFERAHELTPDDVSHLLAVRSIDMR
jgi:hypothetical protein